MAAAIKLVEHGARVTLIEGADIVGGTCVNIGCVPSKILIGGAHAARSPAHHNYQGVGHTRPLIDRKQMVDQQQHWVEALRHAKYEDIVAQNDGIELIRGWARFTDDHTLDVAFADGTTRRVAADRYVIATGARPHVPDIPGLANTPYWTSTEALIAEALPEHLVVVGASVVALELAQAFLHLGVQVTLLARSRLLSHEDPAIGDALVRVLEDEGMRILRDTVPSQIKHEDDRFTLTLPNEQLVADKVLIATGRTPNTDDLGLDHTSVATTPRGHIVVDDNLATSADHIFAVGDCTTLPQYVYVAAAAGSRAAMNMTGEKAPLDLSVLPAVVFTTPQVATVGLTQATAQDQGLAVESRTLTLDNVPRALANMDTRGFVKLVAEAETGRLLGCQVLAEGAGDIIQTAALAIRNAMTVDDLARQLFPYLTMVEALKLCAQTFRKDVKQLSCCAG